MLASFGYGLAILHYENNMGCDPHFYDRIPSYC